jgi:hypothetical protein
MRYLTVSLPLCGEHKEYFNQWGWRLLYILLGVIGLFVVLMAASILAALMLGANAGYVILPIWLVAVLALGGFILMAVIGTRSGVSTRGIERRGMKLANVSAAFASELDQLRADRGGEEDDSEEFEAFTEDTGPSPRPRRRRRGPGEADY